MQTPNGHDRAPPQIHCRVDSMPNGAHLHLTLGGPDGPFIGMLSYQVSHPDNVQVLAQKLIEWIAYQGNRVQPVTGAAAQQVTSGLLKV
jgi:maltose-binding protein MalE